MAHAGSDASLESAAAGVAGTSLASGGNAMAGQAGLTGQSGAAVGQAGSLGQSGSLACGAGQPPEELAPPSDPEPIGADSGAVTVLNDGDVDQAATDVNRISAGAGMTSGEQNGASVWKASQPGAWLEYSVHAESAGTYAINVVYFALQPGGAADVLVDDAKAGSVTFAPSAEVGGYGGIANGFCRGLGTTASLRSGLSRIRIAFKPGSAAVEVLGLQLNFAGLLLSDAGKLQRLSASSKTRLDPAAASDFYRMNYRESSSSWPAQRSFCLVEYLVEAEAGTYALSMKYAGASQGGCSGVRYLVNGRSQAELALDTGAGVTAPQRLELPCGVSRLSIRNANYLAGGEFCGYGADYGEVELTPVP